MGLIEKFDKTLEEYRKEREEKERREKEIEGFLNYVSNNLHEDEAAIIDLLGDSIIIAKNWIGIEDRLEEDRSLLRIYGFTCIPKGTQRYKEYINKGRFGEILMKALKNSELARIIVIEVAFGIIAQLYINDYS